MSLVIEAMDFYSESVGLNLHSPLLHHTMPDREWLQVVACLGGI